jgi:hypothetical protein
MNSAERYSRKEGLDADFSAENVRVTCSHFQAKEWLKTPGVPILTYLCSYEDQSAGKVIVCKGGQSMSSTNAGEWVGVDGRPIVRTFTEKEFLDAQDRCSRLCGDCPQGWK